ncbi:arabinofuranosyltransferase, partial [Kineococcus glutinatus]|uniref:arabinofuranosyltransferase n=1 Tax=Kineococcus glutinatus TaxID=1070872 RepID=UPI0031EE08D2
AAAARAGREPAGRPAVPQAVPGGSVLLAAALAGTLLLAVATSALVQAVVAALPVVHPSNVPTALGTLTAVVAAAAVLALVPLRRLPRGTLALGVVVLSALATLVLALPLHGTPFYLGGNTEDQTFRAQYVGRLAEDWHLADMNYAGVEPFYPAGWFWLAGRWAALSGTPAWEAFKPVAIATVAVVPCLAAVLWARLAGPRRGLLIGLVTTAVAVRGAAAGPFAGEAYSWCLAALVPAVAVLAVRTFEPARVRDRWQAATAIGAFLGLAAMTYTLYAGFAALAVAAACALGVLRGVRAGEAAGAVLRTRAGAL